MKIATRLTSKARQEWTEYLAIHVNSEMAAAAILQEIEQGGNHGVDEFAGASVEIASRYSTSGNPNPLHIPATDFIWEDMDE